MSLRLTYLRRVTVFPSLLMALSFISKVVLFSGCAPTVNGELNESECPDCPVILSEEHPLTFAARAMRFVSKNADTGFVPNALCDSYENYPVDQLPIQEILAAFDNNEGVANCSMAAALLTKVLIDNGVSAYTYSFGFPEVELSHAVTIVSVADSLYLFDPFFNYFLADSIGEALPLQAFFNNILDTTFVYQFRSEPVLGELTVDFSLIDTNKLMLNESQVCRNWAKGYTRLYADVHQIKISRSYDDELNRPCNSFIKRLEKHLQAQTTLQTFGQAMLMKTGDISGAEDQLKVDSLLRAMLKTPSEKWHYRSNTAAIDSVVR